jgi:hypothetical protein
VTADIIGAHVLFPQVCPWLLKRWWVSGLLAGVLFLAEQLMSRLWVSHVTFISLAGLLPLSAATWHSALPLSGETHTCTFVVIMGFQAHGMQVSPVTLVS